MRTKAEKQIESNRDQIGKFLDSELPLEIIYHNIRILSRQNEKLIKAMDNDNN